MKPEFGAGRLTTSEYIVALEDEVHRLNEAYELAAAQATENAIVAVRAMVTLDKLRELVETSAARKSHPAGRGREILEHGTGQVLHVVKEVD